MYVYGLLEGRTRRYEQVKDGDVFPASRRCVSWTGHIYTFMHTVMMKPFERGVHALSNDGIDRESVRM